MVMNVLVSTPTSPSSLSTQSSVERRHFIVLTSGMISWSIISFTCYGGRKTGQWEQDSNTAASFLFPSILFLATGNSGKCVTDWRLLAGIARRMQRYSDKWGLSPGMGSGLYSELYGEAPPKSGIFLSRWCVKGWDFTGWSVQKGKENCHLYLTGLTKYIDHTDWIDDSFKYFKGLFKWKIKKRDVSNPSEDMWKGYHFLSIERNIEYTGLADQFWLMVIKHPSSP